MAKNYSESIDWGQDDHRFNEVDKGKGSSKVASYAKCSDSHPSLKIGKYTLVGGACSYPIGGPYDIEIALDHGGNGGGPVWPWENRTYVYFPISDMQVPKNIQGFKDMIEWTAKQIKVGKKVHVGCIGGHGRTGMFLAALYAHMMPKDAGNAIQYVRKNYCEKAVETAEQVKFLVKEFGVGKVKGYKEGWLPPKTEYRSYETSSGTLYTFNDPEESVDDWWLKKQKQIFKKEQSSGKSGGGSSSPRPKYSGYGAHFNNRMEVPQELRVVEPIKKKGRIFMDSQEVNEALFEYEPDY